MIGFITSPETADAILSGIEAAQTSRGLPHFWTVGSHPIFTGEHAGKTFMPFDDTMMATNLRQGMTPADFPEFSELVSILGGLDARVELDPTSIVDPNSEN
jgi:hypothetical protein